MSVPETESTDTRREGTRPSLRRAMWLVGFGIALALLSTMTWVATRVPPAAGDVYVIEAALSQGPAPAPATTMEAPGPELSPYRFTIPDSPPLGPATPVGLRIPDLAEDAPIIAAGVEPNGEMEIPDSVDEVAWYRFGPSPGEPGSAVLAAHVDLAGQGPGVFYDLRELEPGALVVIDYEDGSSSPFRVIARQTYLKDELPLDLIFSRSGEPVLTLITCGGDFNRSLRSYDSNVVVYATPVEPPPTSATIS